MHFIFWGFEVDSLISGHRSGDQAWYCHGCGTRSLPLLPPSVDIQNP